MKYAFFAACGAVTVASTMTLSAQTPAQPTTRTDQSPITVTGCLKPWDNAIGTSPTEPIAKPGDPSAKPGDPVRGATPMAGTRYVLSGVQPDRADNAGPPQSATPSAGTPAPAHAQASQFIVTAGSGVNLAAHVNHQVRVMGTVDGDVAPAKPANPPLARPGDPPAAGLAGDRIAGTPKWATLTATSVTMLSETCTTTAQQ